METYTLENLKSEFNVVKTVLTDHIYPLIEKMKYVNVSKENLDYCAHYFNRVTVDLNYLQIFIYTMDENKFESIKERVFDVLTEFVDTLHEFFDLIILLLSEKGFDADEIKNNFLKKVTETISYQAISNKFRENLKKYR